MTMSVPTQSEVLESLAQWRFPPRTDARLTALMDRNNNGELDAAEYEELMSLVDLSESISLIRAQAIMSLGRKLQAQ